MPNSRIGWRKKTAENAADAESWNSRNGWRHWARWRAGSRMKINNPLGIILNRIECMEADAARSNVPDEVARDLGDHSLSGRTISRVTRSILTFSRGRCPC